MGLSKASRITLACGASLFFALSNVAAASCTPEQQPPPGQAPNFDINAHLAEFDKTAATIDQMYPPDTHPSENAIAKAFHMTLSFAPHAKYDLKNSQVYPSSQEFGNFFYGAAAQRMGYTEEQALQAAAIVQQFQDFTNSQGGSYLGMLELAEGIVEAVSGPPGTGDNADDPDRISGGHSYSEGPYENDPNRSTSSNSCDNSSSTGSSNSTSSWGGGSFVSGLTFVSLSGCIGNCNPQGIVLVEDIVDPGSDANDN